MSSLTDVTYDPSTRLVRRASLRAQISRYISLGFGAIVVLLVAAFAYQADFFSAFTSGPEENKPVQPAEQTTVNRSTFTGFDKQNRPYSVTAQSAEQDKTVNTLVHLKTLNGESQRDNGDRVMMKADSGLYNTDARTLDISGNVEIVQPGTFSAFMDKAHVIVREKRLVSNVPVKVELANGTIEANGLEVTDSGDNIKFINGVRAKFRSSGSKGDSAP